MGSQKYTIEFPWVDILDSKIMKIWGQHHPVNHWTQSTGQTKMLRPRKVQKQTSQPHQAEVVDSFLWPCADKQLPKNVEWIGAKTGMEELLRELVNVHIPDLTSRDYDSVGQRWGPEILLSPPSDADAQPRL